MEKKNIKGIFKAQNNKKKVSVSLAISNELKEKIKKIAEEEGVSFSFLVNFILEDALNSLEQNEKSIKNQPTIITVDFFN